MSIKFAAVGDLALGDHPARVGFGVGAAIEKKGTAFPFENVRKALSQYDLLFGNLEYPLKKGPTKPDFLNSQCSADPNVVNVLAEIGFNVLNVANNHIAQFGNNVYNETVTKLENNNVLAAGRLGESTHSSLHKIIEVKGIKIGFLGYSLRGRQHFTYEPPYAEGNPEIIRQDIHKLKDLVDHVMVSLHWGDEFIEKPSAGEIMLGRNLIENGASVILGHHPHVLRGVEKYKKGIIAYSLGNFVCDMTWEDRLCESGILEIVLNKSEIESFNLIPVKINSLFQPTILFSEVDKVGFNTRQKKRDNSLKVPDAEYTVEGYNQEAFDELQINRRACHKFFFSNILRFHPKIILQQIVQSFKSRLRDGFYW